MNRFRWIFAHFSCNGPSGVSPRISRFQHAKKTCLRLSFAGRSFVVSLVLCCTDAQKSYQKSTHWFCASGCVMLAAEHRQEEHTLDIELGRGFVAFPRGLTDWEWYTEPNTARLYFHLLLTANWSRKQWQGITIQPGQLVTSRAHLSRQLDMTENQVRSALKHLVSTGDIAIKTGSKYSMITLNHYLELTALNQRSHQQTTNQPPAGHQPFTTTLPSIPSQPEIPSTSSAQTTPTAEPFSEKEGVTEGSVRPSAGAAAPAMSGWSGRNRPVTTG